MNLSPELLADLFAYLPFGAAICDEALHVRWANPRWRTLIAEHSDATESDLSSPATLYHLLPGTESLLQPYVDRALAGETSEGKAIRLVMDSEVLYWDVVFVPAHLSSGKAGFVVLVHDVTDTVVNLRLLERRIEDHARKLSALYDVSGVVGEPGDPRSVIQQSLRRTLGAVQANAGTIQLLDRERKWLILVEEAGMPAEVVDALRQRPANVGLAGWICANRLPLMADLTRDERVSAALRQSDLVAFAGVPMIVRDSVIGVLSTFREKRRPFKTTDLDLLNAVADQIGIAIDYARLRHAQEQLLVTEERNRLARELHDAVTQSLHSLTLFAGAIKRFLEAGEVAQSQAYVGRLGDTAQTALKEMRLLLHNLRPAALEQVGLIQALQQRLDAVEERAGIQTSLTVTGTFNLPSDVEEAMYQIGQEALNNALKHAAASSVDVTLSQEGNIVRLSVADNGAGFAPEAAGRGGLGLTSMRERVEHLRGELSLVSAAETGTTVSVTLDLERVPTLGQGFDLVVDLG